MIAEEKDIALFAVGGMVKEAEKVREMLKEEGYSVTLVNARFVKPVDEEMILKLAENHRLCVTMEENVESGGLGEKVRTVVEEKSLYMKNK